MDTPKPFKQKRAGTQGKDMFFDVVSRSLYTDFPLHWHDFYELQYIQSGHATHIVNGVSHEMGPGDVALLSPVDFHGYENVSAEDPLKLISVKFSDLLLPQNIRNDIYEQVRPMVSHAERAEMNFLRLHEEYFGDGYARGDYIAAGITQICIMLLRDVSSRSTPEDRVRRTPIQQAVLYVRSHYRKSITVEDVANIVHLTPNYFSEYFKKQTGVKFSSYVQKLRLEFAVGLLTMSDISVKQVAEESGFNSAAYFSNAFKDCFGVSPEQFRRSSRRSISAVESIEKLEGNGADGN